jgi:hypothetical protein
MPREVKGKPFGIGSTLKRVSDGQTFVVAGYIVSRTPIDDAAAAQLAAGAAVIARWHEVENVQPENDPHARDVDACIVDQRQADEGTDFVVASAADDGDKVVWGT